jgi:flagellar motor switch protein FliM
MSQSLTPEQIAALVEAAKQGDLQDDAPAAAQRRAPRLRTMNFARPTKFTSDQERRLSRSLESFCRTASTRLSAELRVPIELEVIASTQLTWSTAQSQLPSTRRC